MGAEGANWEGGERFPTGKEADRGQGRVGTSRGWEPETGAVSLCPSARPPGGGGMCSDPSRLPPWGGRCGASGDLRRGCSGRGCGARGRTAR